MRDEHFEKLESWAGIRRSSMSHVFKAFATDPNGVQVSSAHLFLSWWRKQDEKGIKKVRGKKKEKRSKRMIERYMLRIKRLKCCLCNRVILTNASNFNVHFSVVLVLIVSDAPLFYILVSVIFDLTFLIVNIYCTDNLAWLEFNKYLS